MVIFHPEVLTRVEYTLQQGLSKKIFLYQQRQFAKLGKATLSLLEAKDVIRMLVDEIEGTNQLVKSCRIYICQVSSSYWNLPIFVEISTQVDFLNIIKIWKQRK